MSDKVVQSADAREFRAQVRAWIADNAPPDPGFKLPQTFLEVESDRQFDFLREWQRKVYDAGYLGFDTPKEFGGQGVDHDKRRIVSQEMARAATPFMVNTIGLYWAAPTILMYGTPEQKGLIKRILNAEEIWCQGFSEPEFGSDLAGLQTRAVKDGDDFVINGHKVWTTLGHKAKWMILLARTNPDVHKYEGISYFLFPMQQQGVTVQPLVKMTGEGGFNQVLFEDARTPVTSLLGKEGMGWQVAMSTLMFERGQGEGGSLDIGAATGEVLGKLLRICQTSQRDGVPAMDDPVIADRAAQVWVDATAAMFTARRSHTRPLVGPRAMATRMMSKLTATEINQRLQLLACDAMGPEAQLYLDDPNAPDKAEWTRGYMNSYGMTIGGGTSEIQRNILGERVLGLPKSK